MTALLNIEQIELGGFDAKPSICCYVMCVSEGDQKCNGHCLSHTFNELP